MSNIDIAVIGMAFRFPGGIRTEQDYWDLLLKGECAITEIPESRWATELYQDPDRTVPGRSVTFKAGILDRVFDFDAQFFRISPKEAEWMDPQQRFLLEVAYECFENANIRLKDIKGTDCGVYTGISSLDYGMQPNRDLASITPHTMTGNTLSIASNRISYVFDLHGPSISMDTACSSSLVTLHQACQALRNQEVSCALVAGAHMLQDLHSFIGFSKASMLSATGTCRPFDKSANGYVRAEGVAVLLLKPLSQAVKDGNRIHAVIKASGVNTDGSRKNGLTIPSAEAQSELMKAVLNKSGLSSEDIDFVETHGTGTPVGDPIEAKAVSSVYGMNKSEPLPITSVKANVGHMEPMSGLAGLIKAIICLKHGMLPPIPFDFEPNPEIDFEKLNVKCFPQGKRLKSKATYTAGVNSFGFGGSNAHVLVQSYHNINEHDENQPDNAVQSGAPLFLSAKSKKSLVELCSLYVDALKKGSISQNNDLLYSAAFARDFYRYRLAVVAPTFQDKITALSDYVAGKSNECVYASEIFESCRKLCFVFNGNGSQYAGMGKKLFEFEPAFSECFTLLSNKIEKYLNVALVDIMKKSVDEQQSFIENTRIAQPLIFAVQVSLCSMLKKYGIVPQATVGHSVGEIAAAYVAGKLSLDDAVKVICIRSMQQERTKGLGRMSAVSVSAQKFETIRQEILSDDSPKSDLSQTVLDIAAVNSDEGITVSGDTVSLKKLSSYCSQHGIFCKDLKVDYPFHSSFMEIIKDSVLTELAGLTGNYRDSEDEISFGNKAGFYSAVEGTLKRSDEQLDNEYWWHNIRERVNFAGAVESVLSDGYDCLIEIGSNAILQRYLRDIVKKKGCSAKVSSTLLQNSDDQKRIQSVIMDLHLSCENVNRKVFFPERYSFTELPAYPWDHNFYIYKSTPEKQYAQRRIFALLGWPVKTVDYTWENLLEPAKYRLLRDHVVEHECVFAAAAYIETALESAFLLAGDNLKRSIEITQNVVETRADTNTSLNSEKILLDQQEICINLEYLDIINPLVFNNGRYKSVHLQVDPNSRMFTMTSRDYMSADDYLLNIRCRFNSYGNTLLDMFNRKNKASSEHRIIKTVSGAELYHLASMVGLNFGEQFSLVEKIEVFDCYLKTYINQNALQKFTSDRYVNENYLNYVIHPGLIDAGFQSLLVLDELNPAKEIFLPVKFGRIAISKNGNVSYIIARVHHIGVRSVLAGFELYDVSDCCVGILENCRFKKTPRYEVAGEKRTQVKIPLYQYYGTVGQHGCSVLLPKLNAKTLIEVFENFTDPNSYRDNDYRASRIKWFKEILPLTEHAVLCYAYEAFKKLALTFNCDMTIQSDYDLHKVESLSFELKSVNKNAFPLFSYLADILSKHNLITSDKVLITVRMSGESSEIGSGDDVIRYAYGRSADALPYLIPLYRIGHVLPIILSAQTSAEQYEKIVEEMQSNDVCDSLLLNSGMYKAVKSLLYYLVDNVKNTTDQKIRVLELYSGSDMLHDLLKDQRLHNKFEVVYAFTENSASEVTGENENTAVFNPDDFSIVFEDESRNRTSCFDLIIVNSVLHTSSRHYDAVQNLKSYLAPSGIIGVTERFSDWSANMCKGLDPRWWQSGSEQDSGNNSYRSPLKSAAYWKSIFQVFFSDVEIYRESLAENYAGGMSMILAVQNESREKILQQKVQKSVALRRIAFVVSGFCSCDTEVHELNSCHNGSFMAKLFCSLQNCGVMTDYYQNYKELSDLNTYDTVVFLSDCGIAAQNGHLYEILFGESGANKTEIQKKNDSLDLVSCVSNLSDLSRLIHKDSRRPKLVVITFNGSCATNLTSDVIPQQSALIGLTRVVANEFTDLNVRNLDLSIDNAKTTRGHIENIVDNLLCELLLPSENDELVVTSNGEICVALNTCTVGQNSEIDINNNEFQSKKLIRTENDPELKNFSATTQNLLHGQNLKNEGYSYYLDFSQPGRLKNLCWKKKNKRLPEGNEIEVAVMAAGLNFRDIMLTMGLVPDDVLESGFSGPSLGLEFAGTVVGLGSEVQEYKIGDRVMGFGSACFTDRLIVPEFAVAKIPQEWSFNAAATVPIVFFTAWYAISYLAHAEKGEKILIHGAAGGVGIAAVQIASNLGLEVYATAGSSVKRDLLKMLGVRHIYNSRALDFRDQIMADTNNEGVDLCLNCLSGEAMRLSLGVLKPFGRFIELGKRDFVENTEIGLRVLKENITYFAVDADQLFKVYPERAKRVFHDVIESFKDHKYSTLPFRVYSATNVVNAFRLMQHGGHIGKIVIDLSDLPEICSYQKKSVPVAFEPATETAVNPSARHLENADKNYPPVFNSSDTWMITGGTGGFGFATARYLVSKGIKKIVLVSRNGVRDPAVAEEIEKLSHSYDVEFFIENCDVADYSCLSELWCRLKNRGLHIDGIIHAAAVFADTTLNNITEQLYAKVLSPKLQGAINLHRISCYESLKYFVVYSSVAVAIGNVGQANYVAANSGLEGLTIHRLRNGFPSACVEWGPIADAGYLTENLTVKKSLESVLGATSMKSAEALNILPDVISRGGIFVYADMNWADVTDTVGRVPSRIRELVRRDGLYRKQQDSDNILKLLHGKSRDKSVQIIADMLIGDIAETMGLSSDQVSRDQDLQNLGLDSLMAMELIVSIEKRTGTKLSVMMFQDNPTVQKLAEKIYEKLLGTNTVSSDLESDSGEQVISSIVSTHIQLNDVDARNAVASAVENGGNRNV